MDIRDIRIKELGLPTLEDCGLATQYFPNYTNDKLYVHRLDVVLLSFIMRGTCEHWIDGKRYQARAPSIGITHLDQVHCIFSGAQGADIMNLYLDLDRLSLPELPGSLQEVVPRLLPLKSRFVNRFNRVQHLDLPEHSPLPEVARWLDRELQGGQAGWEGAAMACWRLFFTELCRAAGAMGFRPGAEASLSDVRLERVRATIDGRFRESLTLDQLAAVAGLSRTYLCRAFHAYAGKPLFTYLQERRIQAAMLRLRQSDDKVILIANDCGFNDLSHFNRCFLRFCGRTPRQYRRRAG